MLGFTYALGLTTLLLGPPTLPESSLPEQGDAAALSLGWAAPRECGARDQALARLRELMPELPERVPEQGGALAIEVELVEQGTEFRAEIEFTSSRGSDRRSIAGQSCESVAAAVVLVIAVTIDPVGVAEQVWAEPEPVESPATEGPSRSPATERPEPDRGADPSAELDPLARPLLELDPAPDRAPARTSSRMGEGPRLRDREAAAKVHGSVGLLGGGGFGPIDAGMGALAIEVGVLAPWWRVSLRGTWIAPRTIAVDSDPTRSGRYDAWLGGARGCVVPPLLAGRVELPVCAGIEAGVLQGRGVGSTVEPQRARQLWSAIELGPGLRFVPRRWIALGLEVDLVAALLRGGFTIAGEVVQAHAPVGVRALAAVELRFP